MRQMWVRKWRVRRKEREESIRKSMRPGFRLRGKYAPRDVVWCLGKEKEKEEQGEKEKEEKEEEKEEEEYKRYDKDWNPPELVCARCSKWFEVGHSGGRINNLWEDISRGLCNRCIGVKKRRTHTLV